MRAEERLKAEGRLVDGEAAPADILAQVRESIQGVLSSDVDAQSSLLPIYIIYIPSKGDYKN